MSVLTCLSMIADLVSTVTFVHTKLSIQNVLAFEAMPNTKVYLLHMCIPMIGFMPTAQRGEHGMYHQHGPPIFS